MHIEDLDVGMDAQTVEEQQQTDDGDEAQGQHLHLGMGVDEVGDGVDEDHHEDDGKHHGEDHDEELVGQAHGGNDRVDGEHDVHDHDGGNGTRQAQRLLGLVGVLLVVVGLLLLKVQHAAQLRDALVDEVGTAQEQHDVAHRHAEGLAVDAVKRQREQLVRHMHEIRREAQEDGARHEGTGKTELAADVLLLRRKAIGGEDDEDDVVHTQDDLQEHKRNEADPRLRRRKER